MSDGGDRAARCAGDCLASFDDLRPLSVETHVLVAQLKDVGLLGIELEGKQPLGGVAVGLGPGDETLPGPTVHPAGELGDEVLRALDSDRAL